MTQGYGNRRTSLDLLPGGAGRGTWEILDISRDVPYGMGEATEGFGEVNRRYEKHPDKLIMRSAGIRRGIPEAITFPVTTTMRARNRMEDFGPGNSFSLRARFIPTGFAGNMLNFTRYDLFYDVWVADRQISAPVLEKEEEEDVALTFNVNAGGRIIVNPVAGDAVSIGVSAAADDNILASYLYDDGVKIVLYLVTAVDASPTNAYLLEGVIDRVANTITWANYSLTSFSTGKAPSHVLRLGDKVFVISQAGAQIAYASADALSSWTTDATTFASDAPNRLAAPNAATLYVACDGGAVGRSVDGGLSFEIVLAGGALTSSNLLAAAFVNANLGYIGGAAGALLKLENGSFSLLSDPTGGDDITVIAVPADRPNDVYLGTDGGEVWYSTDQGANWTQMRFPGDGSGSVDDLAFVEAFGSLLYILQTNGSTQSRILRDHSGGYGGATNVEEVTTYTSPANSGLTSLATLDANRVYASGNVHSGAHVLVKVTAQEG